MDQSKKTLIAQRKAEKAQKRAEKRNKPKDPKKKFSYVMKKWFFGLGKEFKRITWPTKSKLVKDFFITVIIAALLVVVFLAFDQISALV